MASVDRETAEVVKAPGALVISAYAATPDITRTRTPDIKRPGKTRLLFVPLGGGKARLGGSALAQVYNQVGDESPDIEDPHVLRQAFTAIQELIREDLILAGHDVSDGGLVVALLEMAFAGDCGLAISLDSPHEPLSLLFAEEAGLVMEYEPAQEERLRDILGRHAVPHSVVGSTTEEKSIRVTVNGAPALDEDMRELRALWEETSYRLERLQANPECAEEEYRNSRRRSAPAFRLSFAPEETPETPERPKVAILREEGSNGDREMASAFFAAGFEPWDVTVTDIMNGRIGLEGFRGIAFVGGFSYADVLDSAKGWAGAIRFSSGLKDEFHRFYERRDTFSLGVCNGCQLMALLGWVPWPDIEEKSKPRFIGNRSGRFESRFSTVSILESPSIMLSGMEGSVLGVWVAHGEGRAFFPDTDVYKRVVAEGLAPVRFADDAGEHTEAYPFNPNGSPLGITSLCSPDGRHLALMPHPERAFLKWQWRWMPEEWKGSQKASPWLRMFQNARTWCQGES
jgi:phosphoribosylformylglycinamidine synthase